MQQWFTLSDPAMEEVFFDVPLYREFAKLDAHGGLPDESTILRFRRRLEEHKLAEQILVTVNALLTSKGLLRKAGTVVDATLVAAPASTKNADKARDRGEIKEEHPAVDDAVCAKQFMDGAQQTDGSTRVKAPENRKSAQKRAQVRQMGERSKANSSWIERNSAS